MHGAGAALMNLHDLAKISTIKRGLESWEFGTDEFVLEAWEVMALGGVRVSFMPWGFGIIIAGRFIQADYV